MIEEKVENTESEAEIAARLGVQLIDALELRDQVSFLVTYNALNNSKSSIIFKALTCINLNGETPLILASYTNLSTLEFIHRILFLVQKLDISDQEKIISQVNDIGMNALMRSVEYHLEAFALLLPIIKTLSKKCQDEVINQVSASGWSSLMLALLSNPAVLPHLLPMIQALPRSDQNNLIRQTSIGGWNALMLSLTRNIDSDLFPQLLPMVQALEKTEQVAMIKQVSNEGYHLLLLALIFHPEVIPTLKPMILTLEREERVEIYRQALWMMLQKKPRLLASLFERVQNWEQENIVSSLIAQLPHNTENTLIPVARYYPKELTFLLPMMEKLSPDDQAFYMMPSKAGEESPLTIAAIHHPHIVPSLLDFVNSIPTAIRKTVFDSMTRLDALNAKNKEQKKAIKDIKQACSQCDKDYERSSHPGKPSKGGFFSRLTSKTVKGKKYESLDCDPRI